MRSEVMSGTAQLIGKTIAMVDAGDSLTIRFTDGTYLEVNGNTYMEMNGDERAGVESWYGGHTLSGRAEKRMSRVIAEEQRLG